MRRAARATEGAAFGLAVSIGNVVTPRGAERTTGALTTVDDVGKAVARVKGLEVALPSWWSAPLESFAARAITEPSAYMRLVTDNAQGELSPLEIGIHALGSVELSEGGAGKKGGISEYARQIGKGESYVRQIRSAATVYKTSQLTADFSNRTQHLYEVSRAPEAAWPLLCDALQSDVLTTVDDVGKAVARVKGLEAALPTWWKATLESFVARSIVEPSAYMRLVTDNAQGELSPLEIGIHALGSVTLGEKGRGKAGGFSDYARQIGKSQSYVSKIVAAARVFEEIKNHSLGNDFSEKTKHLYEISLAPETAWPLLCDALQSGALTTVDDVSKAVARVKGLEAALPSWWSAPMEIGIHALHAIETNRAPHKRHYLGLCHF